MTYVAIKVFNGMSLRRFWSLEEEFTKVAGVDVDVSISEHDGVWTYCDVDIDDGNDANSIAAKRLVDYVGNIPMGEILLDWDTMSIIACENCERDDE